MKRAARSILLAIGAMALVGAGAACTSDPSLGSSVDDSMTPSPIPSEAGPTSSSSTSDEGGTLDPGDAGRPDAVQPAPDAGSRCDKIIARTLAAPLVPPNIYAGLTMTDGKDQRGLTIDEANVDGCGVSITSEPTGNANGYRTMAFGGSDGVLLSYNMESRVIYQIVLGQNYRGTAQFHSEATGHFGVHSYEVGIHFVHKDGKEMVLDWGDPDLWADELFDALSDTYSPGMAGGDNCLSSSDCLVTVNKSTNESYFGARDISFYLTFAGQGSQVETMYGFWKGGRADCRTPRAVHEGMTVADIKPAAGAVGASIGGLVLSNPGPYGLTLEDADGQMCDGVAADPMDPGYDAMRWGTNGELELEYNRTTGVAYKLSAKNGYRGVLRSIDATTGDVFVIGVDKLTENNLPISINWANPIPSITILSNAVNGVRDVDCVAAGRCTIDIDTVARRADVGFGPAQIHMVMPTLKNIPPDTIYAVWPQGK